eukprot:Platyproteum_vivax@DN2864_c0_g1_i1.p1
MACDSLTDKLGNNSTEERKSVMCDKQISAPLPPSLPSMGLGEHIPESDKASEHHYYYYFVRDNHYIHYLHQLLTFHLHLHSASIVLKLKYDQRQNTIAEDCEVDQL